MRTPKAQSVTQAGEPDGYEIPSGFCAQQDDDGPTRLLISVPTAFLPRLHTALILAVSPPVSVLYRQRVDRAKVAAGKAPPEGAPPRDFIGLGLDPDVVNAAFVECSDLVYGDARCEIWVRGRMGEQVVLDTDGVLYAYPDDPSFRDVCAGYGLSERTMRTLSDVDYIKHWYHAENDAVEVALIDGLGLTSIAKRG